MSILSSTQTGMNGMPISVEILKKRGYNIINAEGGLIAHNENFIAYLSYDDNKNCWYTKLRIKQDTIEATRYSEAYQVNIKTIGDLFRFEKYWEYEYSKLEEGETPEQFRQRVSYLQAKAIQGCEMIKIENS